MKQILLLILICASTAALCQGRRNKDSAVDTTWYEGAIIKNDGTKLKGTVRYNEALGLVNFRDEYNEQFSYPATRIAGFEYFDPSRNTWRNLMSIENFNEQRSMMALDFHELLMEADKFTVWSKTEPLFMKKEKHYSSGIPTAGGPTPTMPGFTTTESLNLAEVIYVMDPKTDRFHVLMRLEAKQRGTKHLPDDPSNDKHGDLNMSILKQILGDEKVRQLQRYAKENDLNWRTKNDLLKILGEADKL
jgi:hypothetical protein